MSEEFILDMEAAVGVLLSWPYLPESMKQPLARFGIVEPLVIAIVEAALGERMELLFDLETERTG